MKLFRPHPRISVATVADAALLADLYSRVWAEHSDRLDARLVRELQASEEEVAIWAAGGFTMYRAGFDGVLVGAVRCSFPTGACVMDAHVVDPAHRRRGVGGVLVEQVISAAHRAAATKVWVHASPKLEAANALYKSLGFKEIARWTTGYWGEEVALLELSI
jgi:ribosomal protein S18 acetylase RimI-like enzyme